MRISSVPYADEEIPSGDSTPSASGTGQPLLAELLVDQRGPEQAALDRVREGLWEVVAPAEQPSRLTNGH